MEQSVIEAFNQCTSIEVGDKTRIQNLIKNAKVCNADIWYEVENETVSLVFTTVRKNKPEIKLAIRIRWEHLTDEQLDKIKSLRKT